MTDPPALDRAAIHRILVEARLQRSRELHDAKGAGVRSISRLLSRTVAAALAVMRSRPGAAARIQVRRPR